MSQFCSGCKHRFSLAIIYCILLSQLLVLTKANSLMITNTATCLSLNVGHGLEGPDPESSNINVTVSLVNVDTRERSFCYKANTNYSINMATSANTIKGLLMVQDKKYGDFPTGGKSNMSNFRFDLCGSDKHSVSHKCTGPCNLSPSFNFPYTSPSNENYILKFRYSIVFSYKVYHQNIKVQFHPCPEEPTKPITTPSSSMITCNASEYKVQESTHIASHTCPNSPRILIRHHIITENNIVYNCTIDNNQHIKRKMCRSGCLENGTGDVLCCKVRFISLRVRNWTCTAISDDVPEDKQKIHRMFGLTQYRRCRCYRCKDVCPSEITETPTKDSNNDVDISRDDSSEEIDGNGLA